MGAINSIEFTSLSLSLNASGGKEISYSYRLNLTGPYSSGDVISWNTGWRYATGGATHINYKWTMAISGISVASGVSINVNGSVSIDCDFFFGDSTIQFCLGHRGGTLYDTQNLFITRTATQHTPAYNIPESTPIHDQEIYYNGVYQGQNDSCLYQVLTTIKTIHAIRKDWHNKGHVTDYSPSWLFGCAIGSIQPVDALNAIKDNGVPAWTSIEQFSHVNRYPDNYFYNKYNGLEGCRDLYLANQNNTNAPSQKISSWVDLTPTHEKWDWDGIFLSIKDSSAVVFGIIGVEGSFDAVGSDGYAGYLTTGHRAGHAVVIKGWKVHDGRYYFICQNGWGADRGDNGIFYIPFLNICGADVDGSATGFDKFYAVYDDPYAPEPPIENKPVFKEYHQGYSSVVWPAVDGATNYRVKWRSSVDNSSEVIYWNDSGYSINDSYWDPWLNLTGKYGTNYYSAFWTEWTGPRRHYYGHTMMVSLSYYKNGQWSPYSSEIPVVMICGIPTAEKISGTSTSITLKAKIENYYDDPPFTIDDSLGIYDYIRLFYDITNTTNTGVGMYLDYIDIAYPDTTGVVTGLTPDTTYYYTGLTYGSIRSQYRSHRQSVICSSPWAWSANVKKGGAFVNFLYTEWNSFVDKIKMIANHKIISKDNLNWVGTKAITAATQVSENLFQTGSSKTISQLLDYVKISVDKDFYATLFNTARYVIDMHVATGISTKYKDDPVRYSDFKTLEEKTNDWLNEVVQSE